MPLRRLCRLALIAAVTTLVVSGLTLPVAASSAKDTPTTTDNWPQFRGPGGLPVGHSSALPSRWSKSENIEWSLELEGTGWSSPIVWKNHVFLTSAAADKPMKQPSLGVDFSNDYVAELMKEGKNEDEVMRLVQERDMEMPSEVSLSYRLFCVDLEGGKILWQRKFHEGPPPVGRHRKNSFTSETPVTDGEAVYVYVGHLGLFAFDFDGKELWQTPVEAHQVYLDFGGGASPALYGNALVIQNDNEEASFVAAYDKTNGKKLWQTPRPGLGSAQRRSGWSSPFIWQNDLRTEIITLGPGAIISYDLEGQELWRLSGLAQTAIQTPFSWDGLLYVASGAAGEPVRPLVAIRPGADGELTLEGTEQDETSIAWVDKTGGGTYMPTPVLYDGALYILTDKGILSRHDAKTGEQTYKTRIHSEARNFTASPWAYDGKVFALNEEGATFVIRAGEEFELLGINRLDDFAMATPAIAGDRLLIRTQEALYSVRESSPVEESR